MTNLEDILELFARRSRRRNMDNSRNALECVGEIVPDEILDDDDVDPVAVLGVCLPQRVDLSRSRDSNEHSTSRPTEIWRISSPSNTIPLFQKAYQNVCTSVAGHASKLYIEDEHLGDMMCGSKVRTKTSSEDIVCEISVWV